MVMQSQMPRENEINIVHFYRLLCGFVSNGKPNICICEKSFRVTRGRIRRLILFLSHSHVRLHDYNISYTRSNKNINKKYENTHSYAHSDIYVSIPNFTALTYAMCTFGIASYIFIHVTFLFFCILFLHMNSFLHFYPLALKKHHSRSPPSIPLQIRKPMQSAFLLICYIAVVPIPFVTVCC